MFTLDELTLFFWNNSNDTRSQQEGETKDKVIVGWVRATHQQGAASASGSQSSYALAHCLKASHVSSNSVPSSQAMISVTRLAVVRFTNILDQVQTRTRPNVQVQVHGSWRDRTLIEVQVQHIGRT